MIEKRVHEGTIEFLNTIALSVSDELQKLMPGHLIHRSATLVYSSVDKFDYATPLLTIAKKPGRGYLGDVSIGVDCIIVRRFSHLVADNCSIEYTDEDFVRRIVEFIKPDRKI